MKRFSVVIPFVDEKSKIGRTFEYLERQNYPIEGIQIIIINGTLNQYNDDIVNFEKKHEETALIINLKEALDLGDALNIGLQYCSGDFVVFLKSGDVLHPNLLITIDSCLQMTDADLISFKITKVMDDFKLFGEDPLDLSDVEVYRFDNAKKRIEYLNTPFLRENYLGYAYSIELLRKKQACFSVNVDDEDNIFVYPLLLYASTVIDIPDHGYCIFGYDDFTDLSGVTVRIADNQNAQLKLLEELRGDSDVFEEYSSLILAHFIKRYYVHSIEIARASKYDEAISMEQFNLMRFVCLKLVPKWIDNDCIYGFSPHEIKLLKLLNNAPESEEEIQLLLYEDALVSVIITTYNRSKALSHTINNVLNQTYKRIELVVIDDGSTDDTKEVMGQITDNRVKYIRNENNQGVSSVRNIGINNAIGKYIMYHDDDDNSRLDKLEKQIKLIEHLPEEYGAVYHETIVHKVIKDSYHSYIVPSRQMNDVRKKDNIFPALLPKNFVTCPSLLIKKECFDEIGFFDNSLVAYEDWDLTLRLAKRYKIGFDKEPLYDYYLSSTGLISDRSDEHREKVVKALYDIDLRYENDRKAYGINSQISIVDK